MALSASRRSSKATVTRLIDMTLMPSDSRWLGCRVSSISAHGGTAFLDEISELPGWDHPFGVPNDPKHDTPRANYRAAGLADMAQAMVEDRDHRCSFEMCLHVVEVMTSIVKSGEEGRWIEMTTTCERPALLGPDEARALLA